MGLTSEVYSAEQLLNFAAGILIAIGLASYGLILWLHRDHFRLKNNTKEMIGEIFAHVDKTESSAVPHIFAGLCFVGGLSILLAEAAAIVIFRDDANLAVRLALASVAIGILFSFISLWTLWQTRRISFRYGFTINEMHDLVGRINNETEKIIASFRDSHKNKAQPFHRFLLVTTQPLFGSLSPISPELAEAFEQNLRTLANCQRDSAASDKPFEFQIVCGDSTLIRAFHQEYFSEDSNEIERLCSKVENLLNDLEEHSSSDYKVTFRKRLIPPVQFAVVGNLVITFGLQTTDGTTTIIDGNVHYDVRHVQAYKQTFEFNKGL